MTDQTTAAAAPEPVTAVSNEDESITLDIGSEAGAAEEEVRTTGTIRGKVDRRGVATGTGRRKTSVARVRIQAGSGKLTVNERQLEEFFPVERDRQMILAPLKAADALKNVDVWVRVDGGGPTGQAGAVVLGIARALQARQPDTHHALSEGGFLTRDGRMVERKKYGRKKARRSFQFSKR